MVDLSPLPMMLATEQWQAAEALLRRVAENGEPSASVCYNLSKLMEKRGDSAEQETWLQRALERDPGHALSWAALGELRLAQDDPEGAEQAFSRAADCTPEDLEAWRVLMRLRLRLGLWDAVLRAIPHLPRDHETQTTAYRAACECRLAHVDRLRTRLLNTPDLRPDALKALTDVSTGSLPLRLPPLGFPFAD